MFEKGFEHAIISSLSIILLLSHLPCQVDGSEASYEYALIIVSSFDPILIEDEKASDLYDHLVGSGSDPDDIIFLSAYVNTSGSDGIPTIGNVEDSFLDIISWSTGNDRVIVYISDHLPPFANGSYFRFEDGNITFAQVDEWIDSMDCSSIDIYVGGIHSGRSGNHLRGGDRTVICSMKGDQDIDPDQFALARSLEDPTADTNNDGKVSFVEAYWKEVDNLSGTGQDPVLFQGQ